MKIIDITVIIIACGYFFETSSIVVLSVRLVLKLVETLVSMMLLGLGREIREQLAVQFSQPTNKG